MTPIAKYSSDKGGKGMYSRLWVGDDGVREKTELDIIAQFECCRRYTSLASPRTVRVGTFRTNDECGHIRVRKYHVRGECSNYHPSDDHGSGKDAQLQNQNHNRSSRAKSPITKSPNNIE
jgi:hypothetical protein